MGTVIATSPRCGEAAPNVKTLVRAVVGFRFFSDQFPFVRMGTDGVALAERRGTNSVDALREFAVVVGLICGFVCGADQVQVAWNEHAALTVDVGGKTPHVSGGQNGVNVVMVQALR